ncbi:MAG: glycosyltransferase family 39 protein [Endomicrobiaceae bacterium]|jgi:hypothetical protein|nr:glycosyltransferase family 39 protein [Endomicrobiaceae bacterium]MDD3729550.1 glycosyltransferase family 39 protein [Endomicrobiaceae bacterium]MDD4165499.1 glycosyltransferase family 39 protein [Endomicrobiaceae bacterium]
MKIFDFFLKITNKQAIIVIILIACFHFINTLIVLKTNNFYSSMDESVVGIVDMSTSFAHEYKLINIINERNISDLMETLISYWKPPAYFVLAFPFLFFISDIAVFLGVFNFFLSLITLLSVYGIVSKIISKQAGLLASFILSFLPLFFIIHRTFFIETLLASAFALSIYLILPSQKNGKLPNVKIIFAIALGLLTKEQFFLYLPFIIIFAFYKSPVNNTKKIINIILSFGFSLITAYILWYYYLPDNLFYHLIKYAKDNIQTDYFFYLKDFYYFSISPFICISFIFAAVYFIFKKKYLLFILTPLLILFIFSLSPNKVTRHIYPVIIFIPILITFFIYEIKNTVLRNAFVLIFVFFMVLQFILINYSENTYYREKKFNDYNQFKGLAYAFAIPKTETYKMQHLMFKRLLGDSFIRNTVFINVFTPLVYNFLILQKERTDILLNIITYEGIPYLKNDINLYNNIVISDYNTAVFENFDGFLKKNTNFKKTKEIKIYNHNNAKAWLYQNQY